ncbi:hypothetical protein [Treponema sp.]|uniref:hypothetical protein n=1 Tax=Treponema sp. TaxID=166 RepID=UPI003890BEFC
MLTNIKSLKNYLVDVLKIPEKSIEIYNKDGSIPGPNKSLPAFLKDEYGIENADVKEGLKKTASFNDSVTDIIERIEKLCNIPAACIKFLDEKGNPLNGNTHIDTVRKNFA